MIDAPDIHSEHVFVWTRDAGFSPKSGQPYLVGRRGYYRDSLGVPGKNDRGIYDDAIVLVTPTRVQAWRANTDPSRALPGIASLAAGVWRYQLGDHHASLPLGNPRRYPALVQAAPVTVHRDGGVVESGWFGINIHHGGESSTSSEGCQTIPPERWAEFYGAVQTAMHAAGVGTIAYVLTERADG